MFLTEGDNGLEVADLRETANPRRAVHLPLEGYSHRSVLQEGIALVASGFGGLHLLDIQEPAQPVLLSHYRDYPAPWEEPEPGAASSDTSAGATTSEPDLLMTDPREDNGYFRADDLPAYEGLEEEIRPEDIRDREGVLDLAVEGTIAYLAYGSAGVVILDISDPHNPHRIGGFKTEQSAESVAVEDGRAYVTAGIQGLLILDVSDPANPRMLGRLRTRCYPKSVAVKGDFAYLAYGLCGEKNFLVIDVKDPSAPRVVERLLGRIENVRLLGDKVISLGVGKTRGYSLHLP